MSNTFRDRLARHTVFLNLLRTASFCALLALAVGCPIQGPEGPEGPEGPAGPPGPGASLAPGLLVVVENITIPEDRMPEVVFAALDDAGGPVGLGELTDVRFILAYLEPPSDGSTARLVSYITRTEDPDGVPGSGDEAVQATYDGAGLGGITENEEGTFTYKFATILPEDYPPAATHQLGGQFARLYVIDGKTYTFNVVERFRPDGAAVAGTREIVETASCNACHTRLALHGDIRREVQLCILCHNAQSVDANTGNAVDFPQLIHKIHRGEELPSVQAGVPYQIIGYRNSVHDYSTVVFPQDIRHCTVCHKDAPQSDVYKNTPTLAGCGSCHDQTWFGDRDATPEGYTNHVGGAHADNRLCSQCHPAESPGVAPIVQAHLVPTESPAAPGLALDITEVNVIPGEEVATLQIVFTAVDGNEAPIEDLSALNTVAATVAYPVPEYEVAVRETIHRTGGGPQGTLENNGGGSYTYTFVAGLPADSNETFAVAMDGRREFEFRDEVFEQGTATNGITFFTIDGGEPVLRRAIVDDANCNACHGEIRAHGALRTGTALCVMCHNPNASDVARRPQDQFPPVTIHFKQMIHEIHTGEELSGPYTVYGYGGTPYDFTEVRFPGRREVCGVCHEEGSTELPLPDTALRSLVQDGNEIVYAEEPEAAACTSCHDSLLANVHAYLNTGPDVNGDWTWGVESCAICHAPGAAFYAAEVHDIGP